MFSAPMKTGGENVTEEVNVQTPLITSILEALVGKAQGATATADKILEGYSAYVGQQLVNGTAKDASTMVDLLGIFGCTKIAIDKFTLSSRTETSNYTIQYSLGEQPTIAILTCASNPSRNYDVCDIFVRNRPSTVKDYWVKGVLEIVNSTYQGGVDNKTINLSYVYVTDTSFNISEPGFYYESGIEYTLITMA